MFFLHPDSSWRFRKSPLAVSLTWKLDSDSLGDHNMVRVRGVSVGLSPFLHFEFFSSSQRVLSGRSH